MHGPSHPYLLLRPHASIYVISECGLVDDRLSDDNPPIAHLRRLASLRPPTGGRFAGEDPGSIYAYIKNKCKRYRDKMGVSKLIKMLV